MCYVLKLMNVLNPFYWKKSRIGRNKMWSETGAIKLKWSAISFTGLQIVTCQDQLSLGRRRRNIYVREYLCPGRIARQRALDTGVKMLLQHARHRKHKFINDPVSSERTTPGRPGLLSSLSVLRIGLGLGSIRRLTCFAKN